MSVHTTMCPVTPNCDEVSAGPATSSPTKSTLGSCAWRSGDDHTHRRLQLRGLRGPVRCPLLRRRRARMRVHLWRPQPRRGEAAGARQHSRAGRVMDRAGPHGKGRTSAWPRWQSTPSTSRCSTWPITSSDTVGLPIEEPGHFPVPGPSPARLCSHRYERPGWPTCRGATFRHPIHWTGAGRPAWQFVPPR
jgi:hypothetical protein